MVTIKTYNVVHLPISLGNREIPDVYPYRTREAAAMMMQTMFVVDMIANYHLPEGTTPLAIGLASGKPYNVERECDKHRYECFCDDAEAMVEWSGGANLYWIVEADFSFDASEEDSMPEHTLVFGDVGAHDINCKKCGKPLRWAAPKMVPVYCLSPEYVGSDTCMSCMRTGIQMEHYYDDNKEEHISTFKSLVFTPGFEPFCHRICLINSTSEDTEFEVIPDEIRSWWERIGEDDIYPNLVKYWDTGYKNEKYGFTFHFEIPNPNSDDGLGDDICVSYEQQLQQLAMGAQKIAERIPLAEVRLSENGAFKGQHSLEVAFMYPCDPLLVQNAAKVLEAEFSYIPYIGDPTMEDME